LHLAYCLLQFIKIFVFFIGRVIVSFTLDFPIKNLFLKLELLTIQIIDFLLKLFNLRLITNSDLIEIITQSCVYLHKVINLVLLILNLNVQLIVFLPLIFDNLIQSIQKSYGCIWSELKIIICLICHIA
jgi:hypothetical protein